MKKVKYLIATAIFLAFFSSISSAQTTTQANTAATLSIVNYLLSSKSFVNTLKMPTFTGLSQGKLVVECKDDVIYYIMAYNCLRSDTKPSVKANVATVVTEGEGHITDYDNQISIYYTKGHIERTGPVDVVGEVFSGGETLNRKWIHHCK